LEQLVHLDEDFKLCGQVIEGIRQFLEYLLICNQEFIMALVNCLILPSVDKNSSTAHMFVQISSLIPYKSIL